MNTLMNLDIEFELGDTNYRLSSEAVNSSELTNMKLIALTCLITEFNKCDYVQPATARDFIVKNGLEDLFTETPLTCFKEGNFEKPEILSSTDEWLEKLSSLKGFTILYSNGNEDFNVLRILRCNNSGVDFKVTETGHINGNRLVYRIERIDNFFHYPEHTLLSRNSINSLRKFDVVLKGNTVCCRITKRVFELYEKGFFIYGFKFLGFYESLNPIEMVEMVKKDK